MSLEDFDLETGDDKPGKKSVDEFLFDVFGEDDSDIPGAENMPIIHDEFDHINGLDEQTEHEAFYDWCVSKGHIEGTEDLILERSDEDVEILYELSQIHYSQYVYEVMNHYLNDAFDAVTLNKMNLKNFIYKLIDYYHLLDSTDIEIIRTKNKERIDLDALNYAEYIFDPEYYDEQDSDDFPKTIRQTVCTDYFGDSEELFIQFVGLLHELEDVITDYEITFRDGEDDYYDEEDDDDDDLYPEF